MRYLFLIPLLLVSQISLAGTKVTSQFGFTAVLPDDWFLINSKKLSVANKNETIESLGLQGSVDKEVLNGILNKVKSGNIEFYYDKKYFNKDFKNNISAQLSAPLLFNSMDDVKQACKDMPGELKKVFGGPVNLHSCKYLKVNGWPVFHHAYTVPSQNVTIINENVYVNKKYSIIFVGGSGNGIEGLHRARAAQQALIESIVKFFKSQNSGK